MSAGPAAQVTLLLRDFRPGDDEATSRLVELIYPELKKLAQAQFRRERPSHDLQPTALVHEAYLRLVDARRMPWQNRAHFFAVCAQAMRCIVVDAARARDSLKRGGQGVRIAFRESRVASPDHDVNLLALDEALTDLAKTEPRKSKVVELRYFGGLSVEETAEVLGLSPQTVMRDWKMAKLLLARAIRHGASREGSGAA